MRNFENKIGMRFGRLLVIERVKKPDNRKTNNSFWLCKCDCGNVKVAESVCLNKGEIKSCGCLRKELRQEAWTTHGKTGSLEFDLFCAAKSRAIKSNIKFDIELDDIEIPEKCPILDIPLFKSKNKSYAEDNSPSLDKVNPSLGYVRGNVRVISFKANRMKQNNTKEDFEKLILYMEGKI